MRRRAGPALTRRRLMGGAACAGALALLAPPSLGVGRLDRSGHRGAFPLVTNGYPAAVLVDSQADSAVLHAARSFAADLERVSGNRARMIDGGADDLRGAVVVIGVLGHSTLIDALAAAGKIDITDLQGEWEAFRQIVVDNPFPGVPRALVVVGSDRS
jgi:hypothetical protein